MSAKHPIISITGSSGAGTTSVKRIFEQIFRRENIEAAFIEGDAFHKYDRNAMKAKVAEEEMKGNPNFTHFNADANELQKLDETFEEYATAREPAKPAPTSMTMRKQSSIAHRQEPLPNGAASIPAICFFMKGCTVAR